MSRALRIGTLLLAVVSSIGVASAQEQPNKRLADAERGEELYLRHCVQCHGATGAGDGPATAALVAPVPDLRGGVENSRLDELARLILDGKGAMPAFETSFDRYDARRALRYLQRIGRDLPDEAAEPEADDEEDTE